MPVIVVILIIGSSFTEAGRLVIGDVALLLTLSFDVGVLVVLVICRELLLGCVFDAPCLVRSSG